MRYSDAELSAIKNTFCENDSLAKTLRKFFLQGEMTTDEINVIRSFTSQEQSVKLLRKTLMPEIDFDAPAFQIVDLYMNIDTKTDSVDRAYPLICARDLMYDYFAQQFDILEDKKAKTEIVFKTLHRAAGKEAFQAFIELSARNTITQHIESQLYQLLLLAGKSQETVEETKSRLRESAAKNSSK